MPDLSPFADGDYYGSRTGQNLSDTTAVQVGILLYEASALMRDKVADLDARIAAGTLDRLIPAGIAVDAVQRYLANPTRAAQLGEGPYTAAYAAVNTRGLWLTEDDLTNLGAPATAGRPRGVGSIRVGLPVGTARANRPLR